MRLGVSLCYSKSMDKIEEGIIYGVYDLREPDRCRYIGQTVQRLPVRAGQHWCEAERGNKRPILCWLRSRNDRKTDVVFRELDSVVGYDNLDLLEIEWISLMRSEGQADLNLADGGGGSKGYKVTEERRAAMSIAAQGENNPMYGVKRPELAKHARSFLVFTPEIRAKMSVSSRASWTQERRDGQAERMRNRVREPLSYSARESIGRARANLTDDQVRAIREAKNTEPNNQELARMFSVPYSSIRAALGHRGAYFWVK